MAKYRITTNARNDHVYIQNMTTKSTHFTYHPKHRNDRYLRRETDQWSIDTREPHIFKGAFHSPTKPQCWGKVKKMLAEFGYNLTEPPK